MKLRITAIILVVCFLITLCSCTSNKENIFVNGNVTEIIGVNMPFSDKGVTYPHGLTLVVDGEIDTSVLGRCMM